MLQKKLLRLSNIILDLNHRDKLLEGEVKIIDDKTIEVFRRSEAWATNQYIYARIEFSKPMKISKKEVNGKQESNLFTGTKLALVFSANVKRGEKINIKVSISPTGYEGAEKNMLAEGQSKDFESIKKQSQIRAPRLKVFLTIPCSVQWRCLSKECLW